MSFELAPVQGNVHELETDLEAPPQHTREEDVIPVVKSAIKEIVDALGGYLSVSANGNINPASGESGDHVSILITSLPAPGGETPAPPVVPGEETPNPAPAPGTEGSGEAENKPEGSVLPEEGAVAPGNSGNEPGLENPPVVTNEEVTTEPPAEAPTTPVTEETSSEIPNPEGPPVVPPSEETPGTLPESQPAEETPVPGPETTPAPETSVNPEAAPETPENVPSPLPPEVNENPAENPPVNPEGSEVIATPAPVDSEGDGIPDDVPPAPAI